MAAIRVSQLLRDAGFHPGMQVPVPGCSLAMPMLFSLQLDPENTGFIGVETFASLVHSHELPLDPAKLDMLVALAQGNDEGQVCYQELVDLVSAGVTR